MFRGQVRSSPRSSTHLSFPPLRSPTGPVLGWQCPEGFPLLPPPKGPRNGGRRRYQIRTAQGNLEGGEAGREGAGGSSHTVVEVYVSACGTYALSSRCVLGFTEATMYTEALVGLSTCFFIFVMLSSCRCSVL